jgi:hypothetical protein
MLDFGPATALTALDSRASKADRSATVCRAWISQCRSDRATVSDFRVGSTAALLADRQVRLLLRVKRQKNAAGKWRCTRLEWRGCFAGARNSRAPLNSNRTVPGIQAPSPANSRRPLSRRRWRQTWRRLVEILPGDELAPVFTLQLRQLAREQTLHPCWHRLIDPLARAANALSRQRGKPSAAAVAPRSRPTQPSGPPCQGCAGNQ